jgi:ACS family tartrate transporter-like MFS transporter
VAAAPRALHRRRCGRQEKDIEIAMQEGLAGQTIAKVTRRLIPLAMVLFIINYLDRVNISFAALQMNKDLGFSPSVYGLGAGIFFLGYFLFELPSNLILHRVGARRWIARIMVTWGIVATAMAWVSSPTSFYVMRFLLGVAEAGFFPGIILYFTYWFPGAERARAVALFMTATAIANVIGAPLSVSLLGLNGLFGLKGWQVLFLVEGLPAVALGLWVLGRMTDKPEQAAWLTEEQKRWLAGVLAEERAAKEAAGFASLRQGLTNPRVLLITALCFCLIVGNFGLVFWMPQIIKAYGGLSNGAVGGLTAIPYLLAIFAMVWWGRHSDRTGERRWHSAAAAALAAVGLVCTGAASVPAVQFAGLCVATVGIWSMFGVFWALPADFLTGVAAAAGIALINSFGTLGAFVGNVLIGVVRERTGSFKWSLLMLAAFMLAAALLSVLLGTGKSQPSRRREQALPPPDRSQAAS